MITLTEQPTQKLPGETSIFLKTNYNPAVIEIIKSYCDARNYDRKTKIWEIPITSLSTLIDNLTDLDDIQLDLMEYEISDTSNAITDIALGNFKTPPYSYQLDGIKYGLQHDNFLLLDAPGLGKTLQICYIAQELYRAHKISHCLIICGINTLKFNWKKEIEQHTDLSCRILGEKINSKGEMRIGSISDRLKDLKNPIDEFFVITNVQTLRESAIISELRNDKSVNKFDMIVVDEVHTCKSPSSIQGKNLLKLNAEHKIALTGTLIMNNPLDAYMALKWLGIEKSTYTNFKYYYCNYGGKYLNKLVGFKHLDILKHQLDKCSIRRTKDLLDLPEKTIIDEIIEMNEDQKEFYTNLCDGIVKQADLVSIDTDTTIAMISRLRQATTCPSVLTSENISSAKFDRTVDLVEQIVSSGNKVVIFSTYKESVKVLAKMLNEYEPLVCTGDVKDAVIAKNIENFQTKPNNKVMICTIAKMGTGITLTAASYAIFVDCAYTAAQNLQCEDRIYRIGSKNKVFIYYLWCKNTIDERVKEIVNDKEAISDYIIDDKVTKKSIMSLKKYLTDITLKS